VKLQTFQNSIQKYLNNTDYSFDPEEFFIGLDKVFQKALKPDRKKIAPTDSDSDNNYARNIARAYIELENNDDKIIFAKLATYIGDLFQIQLFQGLHQGLIELQVDDTALDDSTDPTLEFCQILDAKPSYEELKARIEDFYRQCKTYRDVGDSSKDFEDAFNELVQAKPSPEQWRTYSKQVALYLDEECPTEELTRAFCKLVQIKPSFEQWQIYAQQVASYIDQYQDTCGLSIAACNLIESNKVDSLGKPLAIFVKVKQINDKQTNPEAKIEINNWLGDNVIALLHLEDRYPKIHKFLLGQLEDRKNTALYAEEIAIFNELNEQQLEILDHIYQNKQDFFNNDQRNFLKLARLIKCFSDSPIKIDEIKALKANPQAVFRFFGEKLLGLLQTQFGIKIDKVNFNIENFEKNWDIANLGTLLVASNTWEEQDAKLFQILIQAAIDGKLNQLFSDQVDKSADEITKTVQKAFKEFKKVMKEYELNFAKWQNAYKVVDKIEASRDLSSGTQASYRQLFTAFQAFITKQKIRENLDSFKQDNLSISGKKSLSNLIKKIIEKQNYAGNIPEAIADLQNYLNQKEDKRNTQYISIADPSDLGHNLFAGNRANSCTAFGSNAKAILYLLSDPGTKYILVKNAEGNITGYARIFLTLDKNNQAKIFIDSVDGSAHNFMPGIKQQLEKLAKEIGITQEDFSYTRNSKIAKVKLGSSPFPKSYFHHASRNMVI
jgi:hypothetical protein